MLHLEVILENHFKFLHSTFLFFALQKNVSRQLISELKYTILSFNKGDTVYSPKEYERKLGFVVSGGCSVYKYKSSEKNLLLNSLHPGDSFGVLAVFTDAGEFPTVIEATKKTEILFIDRDECLRLISESSEVALSVIGFLANKVSFLNTKISTLSGKNISEKLAIYLLCDTPDADDGHIRLNVQRASSALSVSRQSIYRAIETLEASGLIKHVDNKIHIMDRIGLERLTK